MVNLLKIKKTLIKFKMKEIWDLVFKIKKNQILIKKKLNTTTLQSMNQMMILTLKKKDHIALGAI